MKKIIALALCLMMTLSMAACGGESSSAPTASSAPEGTVSFSQSQQDSSEESSSEDALPEVSFDNSWAANEFESLIPQPPFEGWSGQQEGNSVYKMETSQANADGSGTYYDQFAAYASSLADCGYIVEGDFNEFRAEDEAGNVIDLLCGDGFAWITITKAAG